VSRQVGDSLLGDPVDDGRTRKRLIIAAGAVLAAVITVVGVIQFLPADDGTEPVAAESTSTPERELTAVDVANQFLDAFTSGDATAAGALTDDANGATTQLTAVWRTLTPTAVTADRTALVEPAADVGDERFTLTWTLGPQRSWSYESTLRLTKKDKHWRVRWQPTLVHPRLAAGQSLGLRDGTGQPAVADRDGAPLLTWSANGTQAADAAVAPRLLPAMGRVASEQGGGASGWYVALIDGAGKDLEVLYGTPAAALTSTLSVPVQKAAQAAVDAQQLPAMLVAIQPSTGGILAVAQNSAAGDDPVALHGLYPPGSTFKIATATALIEGGIADVGTVVPCPGSTTIGQRTVKNANFELGNVPLRTAFAKSCNTTFARQAAKLPPAALSDAAGQLGLAADFQVPGITTETGSVPAPANATEQVEDSIGQGRVTASCFGMALTTATVAAGRAVTPRLWRDIETTVDTGYQAPPATVIGSLRTMMRDAVTSGTATDLARYGAVFGKTGTAEVDATNAHGWFAGYRGDIAFATLVLDASTSKTAVAVTGAFLGAIP
jgi:hypothetical protein